MLFYNTFFIGMLSILWMKIVTDLSFCSKMKNIKNSLNFLIDDTARPQHTLIIKIHDSTLNQLVTRSYHCHILGYKNSILQDTKLLLIKCCFSESYFKVRYRYCFSSYQKDGPALIKHTKILLYQFTSRVWKFLPDFQKFNLMTFGIRSLVSEVLKEAANKEISGKNSRKRAAKKKWTVDKRSEVLTN